MEFRNGGVFLWETLINEHGFWALFKPYWLLIIGLIAYLYVTKIATKQMLDISKKQKRYFMTGLFFLLLAQASPLSVLGEHYLFSALVLQLSIQYFLVLPLLMIGLPKRFFRQYIWDHRTKFMIGIAAHPWVTLFMFNGLLSVFLLPSVLNFMLAHPFLMLIAKIVLFINAFLMWWVILNPVPEMSKLTFIVRAAYIFFASVALIPIGFFYIVVQTAYFPVYEAAAGFILPGFTAIYDQQLAGATLKLFQLSSYIIALLFILIDWRKKDEGREGSVDKKNIRLARGVVIHLDKNNKPIR